MALAAAVVNSSMAGPSGWEVSGTLALSGTYPTGGEPWSLQSYPRHFTARKPDFVEVIGKSGFIYQYDGENEKLLVYANVAGGPNASLGEHTAATYAAGVSGDVIRFNGRWKRPGF